MSVSRIGSIATSVMITGAAACGAVAIYFSSRQQLEKAAPAYKLGVMVALSGAVGSISHFVGHVSAKKSAAVALGILGILIGIEKWKGSPKTPPKEPKKPPQTGDNSTAPEMPPVPPNTKESPRTPPEEPEKKQETHRESTAIVSSVSSTDVEEPVKMPQTGADATLTNPPPVPPNTLEVSGGSDDHEELGPAPMPPPFGGPFLEMPEQPTTSHVRAMIALLEKGKESATEQPPTVVTLFEEHLSLVGTLSSIGFNNDEGHQDDPEDPSKHDSFEVKLTEETLPQEHQLLVGSLRGLELNHFMDTVEEAIEEPLPEDPMASLSTTLSEVWDDDTEKTSPAEEILGPVAVTQSPTQFEKICAEVIKTERTFYAELLRYQVKLKGTKSDAEQKTLAALEEMIKASSAFLESIEEYGAKATYGNEKLMDVYVKNLENMAQFYLAQYPTYSILPIQRGPRHELIMKEFCKLDADFEPLLKLIGGPLAQLNHAPKKQQLRKLIQALEELRGQEQQKIRSKIRIQYTTTSLDSVEYIVDKRKTKLFKKKETEQLTSTDKRINGSLKAVHHTLSFLLEIKKHSDLLVDMGRCLNLLEASNWFQDICNEEQKGLKKASRSRKSQQVDELAEKPIAEKLQQLTGLLSPSK